MEGEAFSDRAIADYMNANFLPIKVDREERPDIDSIYMQALQAIAGQGGWPLNIFLTPDGLVPFYGGTYFPVEPRYGRPGFLQVLQAIRNFYDREKIKLGSIAAEMFQMLQQSALLPPSNAIAPEMLKQGLAVATSIVGFRDGGQCFPMIPYADAALRAARFGLADRENRSAREICAQRGVDLAAGGIFDHVGGGFHRYTVDANWTVPHFEKMLYDNGQILEYLANLWASGDRKPLFERAIAKTAEWLQREMTAPEGYFYAAQDADSFISSEEIEPEEGAFYVWDYQELESLLSNAEIIALEAAFTVSAGGNFEGHNVLQRREDGEFGETVETALAKLFRARYGAPPEEVATFPPARNNREAKENNWPGRIPAVTDTKMVAAWNAIAISGLAKAGMALGRSSYIGLAAKAATFLLENQWRDDRFHRVNYEGTIAVLAQSEDYALFVKALLDLHAATLADASAAPWLDRAVAVQREFDEYLWSVDGSGYFNTASDASDDLLVRERSYADNATPSANGIAAANLVRLSLLTGDVQYLSQAEKIFQAFGSAIEKNPQACPSLFAALDWFYNQTLVRLPRDFPTGSLHQRAALLDATYLPVAAAQIADLPEGIFGMVCQGLTCKEPARDEAQFWRQLEASQQRQGI